MTTSPLSSRWPFAGLHRRSPSRGYEGVTPDVTAALHEGMYLDELDRQATIFNNSFADAITAALVTNDTDDCWRHLQSSLFAGIIVSRLVDPHGVRARPNVPKEKATEVASNRAVRLREIVGLPDPSASASASPIYLLSTLRDSMEHIDERMDRVINDGGLGSVSDWYLSSGHLLVTDSRVSDRPPLGLRAFIPTEGQLYFNDESLDMFLLDLHMLILRNNIAEARIDMQPRLHGRFTYAGINWVELGDPQPPMQALEDWDLERRRRLSVMPTAPQDRSVIWLDPGDSSSSSDESRSVD